MHSVDLLEEALRIAMDSGFEIRQEWLGDTGGGACRIGKRWVLFVDLSQTAQEQLARVVAALQSSGRVGWEEQASSQLRQLLQ